MRKLGGQLLPLLSTTRPPGVPLVAVLAGQQPAQCSNVNRGRVEQDRRLALPGKCFRCAKDDHLLPQCSYPERVKCNLYSATGHIIPAWSCRQNVRLAQHVQLPPSISLSSQQLAIAYNRGSTFPVDGATFSWDGPSSATSTIFSSTRAGVFYTPPNRPTPEMVSVTRPA